MDAIVTPEGSLELLSQTEVNQLLDASQGGLYDSYRRCSLAVLNWGSHLDDSKRVMEQFGPFELRGDPQVIKPLDSLLKTFVAGNRMKLSGSGYKPCYRTVA